MRIPHIINKNTIETYQPSSKSLELVGEAERKYVAENFIWDKDFCPSLRDYCVEAIAKHFENKPILDELPCSNRVRLLEILSLNLPLETIIPLIHDEYYWERRYKEKFGLILRPKPQQWTWKSLYLERHVQELIEQAQPQYNDEETFEEIMMLCSPFVSRVFVEQLQPWKPPLTMEKEDIPSEWPIDHINMTPIFKKLPNVVEVDIIYGVKNVGEDFSWSMFKLSAADCQRLGKALLELKYLKIVRIHRSNLEYKHCQALIQGLVQHRSIEELDLSNCQLTDAGALCVAYLLKTGTNLKVLKLANNNIGKIGCEGIGFAMLSGNCESLEVLDLKLNPLGTEGSMGIMRALVRCSIPKKISMSCCLFEDDTPLKICQMLRLNNTLKKLDISGNWFGEDGGEELVKAVEVNTNIEWLDARDTDILNEQQEKINEYLIRNRNEAAVIEAYLNENDSSIEVEKKSFVYQ